MNSSLYFKLLFSQRYRAEKVKIEWQPEPRTLPSELLQNMHEHWQTTILATEKQGHIFNGKLCRLNSWRCARTTLTLSLGQTSYKELLFSNSQVEVIEKKFGQESLSRALGISAILISADGRLILIKRSSRVGEYPQAIDVLGGHIHPRDHAVSGIPDPFTAMRDELLEEIDLTVSQDETFECIGLVETANTRKPELIFHVNSKLPEQKIIEKGRQKQSPEISDLFSIANNRVEILAFLNRSKEHMSFSAIGALWLYAHSIA